MDARSMFKTLVVLDLETTGLAYDEPKITELAMIAVSVSALNEMPPEMELPRALNKFVKFFNPAKPIHAKAMEITDLDNRLLANAPRFTCDSVKAIDAFLNDLQKPIVFAAHNGNLFDFPVLLNEIQSASIDETSVSPLTSVACVDSLTFFRDMHRLMNDADILQDPHEQTSTTYPLIPTTRCGYVEIPAKSNAHRPAPSMKLDQIYAREFNRTPHFQSHRAENDCLILLATLRLYLPDWLEWIENNHRPLRDFFPLPSKSVSTGPPKPPVRVKRPLRF